MRILVDTNVFVGACLGAGASNAVIAACLRGELVPLMGTALMNEYEAVLSRSHLFQGCRLDAQEREALLDVFFSVCQWTHVYYGWRPNLPDEGDNHLIELAVAGGASHIVTRNLRDLCRMELKFSGLVVVTPEQFLREVRP